MEMMEQKNKPENSVLEHNTLLFLITAFIYSICFAIAFYKNFVGLTYPLITIATLAVCGLFLKKSGMVWKKENRYYIVPIILFGISTMLTTSRFIVFFNTVGILFLITILMIHQVYKDEKWNLGQYICNILFLYVNMIPEVAAPFINIGRYIRRKRIREEKNTNAKYITLGILIGMPMLIFVMALLSSADAIFSRYIGKSFQFLWKNIFFSSNIIFIVVLMILGFFGIYTFLSALTLNNMPEWGEKKEKKNPVIAITFTVMITVVYIIFSVIQIIFLFTGGLMLPEGYTYSQYAHQGFFQLLFLCIFNLLMVISCMAIFEMSSLLKTVLMIFSGCTFIMIVSSAYRMILYISSYHLTFLRILVLWFLALLVILMVGVIVNIYNQSFSLFRYGIITVTLFYLLFSFGRPDYWIAKYNISAIEDDIRSEDVSYLCSLSLDAAPALAEINLGHTHGITYYNKSKEYECPACQLDDYFQWVWEENKDLNVRTFNVSKFQAAKTAKLYLK